jgi:hypothetical protein
MTRTRRDGRAGEANMTTARIAWLVGAMALLVAAGAVAQPRLVTFDGIARDALGAPRAGVITLTFRFYTEPEGGLPVFTETRTVTADDEGRYTVTLGATSPGGLPPDLFATGATRWLGVQPDGQVEAPRILLVSVPYALKAADADTVGGKPASAFVLADSTVQVSHTAESVTAQATSGTAGYLGVFTNTTDLGNSVIFENTGRIGVGTTAPEAAFHSIGREAPGAFFDVYNNVLGALPVVFRAARGTPEAPSAVQAHDILGGLAVRGYATTGFPGGKGQVMFRAAENWTDSATGTYLQFTTTPTGSTSFAERMRIAANGRVGIGTATPTALLHVAGDIVVDGNIAAKYQDVAEWVESGGALDAGTVVIVDPEAMNGVRVATRAYDVAVAGAVSAQPGVILGEGGATKSLVAQSGRVRIKVDARYGAIRPGDLLVTSPTPGHAMVSKPLKVKGALMHRPGTILGKALAPLAGGTGEILVLLTLQ